MAVSFLEATANLIKYGSIVPLCKLSSRSNQDIHINSIDDHVHYLYCKSLLLYFINFANGKYVSHSTHLLHFHFNNNNNNKESNRLIHWTMFLSNYFPIILLSLY